MTMRASFRDGRFLLNVGDFVPCFRFDLLSFHIESFSFSPNPNCSSAMCRERQLEERTRSQNEVLGS